MDEADEEAFSTLVAHAKKRRIDQLVAVGQLAREKVVEGLENVTVETAPDYKHMITAAAISEDKLALLENRLPGQAPLALALLVNGDIGIDNRTVNISEKELEQLAEARLLRSSSRPLTER
jgi:hypothetical protein